MRWYRLFWFCVLALAMSVLAQAQTSSESVIPHVIQYNGTLAHGTGVVGVTFAIYQNEMGGAPLWVETQSVTLDAQGRYRVNLGSSQAHGLPSEIFAGGEGRWLGVQMEGQAELRRVLLVSVPYAMKAADSDTLGGYPASAFLRVSPGTILGGGTNGTNGAPGATGAAPSAAGAGATNFVDSTSNQIVGVTQNGDGMGIFATSTTGYAIRANGQGIAIYGLSNGTGSSAAVQGSSTSATGKGVYGSATSTTGINYGVIGSSSSPQGIGVYGYNNATSGTPVGFWGAALSPNGIAVKASANSTTGTSTGVLSTVASIAGTPLVLQNTASGRLISGQSGAGNTQVFQVDGSGKVFASAYADLAGNPIAAGTVTSVSADAENSIAVSNGTTTPILKVAGNGITNLHIADAAISPAKITGYAAVLGALNPGSILFNGNVAAASFNSLLRIDFGQENTINGNLSNSIASPNKHSVIGGGGYGNTIPAATVSADITTIAGGGWNTASDQGSIGGGYHNTATGLNSTVPGGWFNRALAKGSFAAGSRSNVTHLGAMLLSDDNETFDFNSTANNEFAVRAEGGVRFVTAVDGTTGAPTTVASIDPSANIRTPGMLRVGKESEVDAITTGIPYQGVVIRRLFTHTYTAGTVVAVTDRLSFQRDGSYGGFQLLNNTSNSYLSIACTAVTSSGGSKNVYHRMGASETFQVFLDADAVAYFECRFGDTFDPDYDTKVSLHRLGNDYYWLGELSSTFNQ